jgi:molybdate transport system substrate-binding protein
MKSLLQKDFKYLYYFRTSRLFSARRSHLKHLRCALFLLSATCLFFTACGGSASAPTNNTIPVTLKVFAAVSLKAPFTEIKSKYESTHPGVSISYNFDGSQILENQLASGAAADVFASADQSYMQKARNAGLVSTSQIFAKNKLIVIVPKSNPAKIYALKDLASKGVKIDIADPSVPVGQYSLQVLDKLGKSAGYGPAYENSIKANLISQETNDAAVVQKVQLGEADAGIVYQSDITSANADKVIAIDIPANVNIIAEYPIAVTKGAAHAKEAQAFVSYILSPDGQAVLAKYHFIPVKSPA